LQKEVLDKIAALITGVSGFVAAILYAVIVTIIIAAFVTIMIGRAAERQTGKKPKILSEA
jgi:hypothetical protein